MYLYVFEHYMDVSTCLRNKNTKCHEDSPGSDKWNRLRDRAEQAGTGAGQRWLGKAWLACSSAGCCMAGSGAAGEEVTKELIKGADGRAGLASVDRAAERVRWWTGRALITPTGSRIDLPKNTYPIS
jgi:hypothetical protein